MDAQLHRWVQRQGWNRAASCYERYWGDQLRPAVDLLLASADLRRGERVLDVAAGTGAVALDAAVAVGTAGGVLATDLSSKMLDALARRAAQLGCTNVEVACCGAEDLDVADFDVALCSLGLMYVPSPHDAAAALWRSLRPGGRAVVSVWGDRRRCGWAEIFPIVDARVASDVCPMFFALGNPGALTALLTGAGFASIHETRLAVELRYADASDALGAAFLGGPVALAASRFSPEDRDAAYAEYLESIAGFADGAGYRIPGEFVVATAERPGPTHQIHRHHTQHHTPTPHTNRSTDMTITDTRTDKGPVDNGVNTEALLGARTALSEAPEAAEFTWRATCDWQHGTYSRTTIDSFVVDADHPECFASEDRGATPAEHVLAALASCLTAGVAAVAQHREIQLNSVTATIEGRMNVLGILGADPGIRNGFDGITVRFAIDADATADEIAALVAQSQKRSAVFDVVTNPTHVTVEVA
jgi:SAM-dependent methyltransferase/uncharacterized OsmC-like protein